MSRRMWLALGLIVACITASTVGAAKALKNRAVAVIRPTTSGATLRGTAIFTPVKQGLRVVVHVTGAPPGLHGMHLHEHGACGNQGKAAGGHYNPDHVKHGFLPKDGFRGAHAGDFGNITIGPDGSGSLTLTVPELRLSDPTRGVVGHAVILHAQPDDFSQPTGNAGDRIGCGVVK